MLYLQEECPCHIDQFCLCRTYKLIFPAQPSVLLTLKPRRTTYTEATSAPRWTRTSRISPASAPRCLRATNLPIADHHVGKDVAAIRMPFGVATDGILMSPVPTLLQRLCLNKRRSC